ncbi:hypothetical protein P152DRAFT_498345 [Eremomyces bilateralis CBS 781.70]|uniref:Protein kinase domain-containing protein n=1 Tax=Eremomyces bilateralis CBS 781.70 TaxID=1392243 RepID=A0A6G1G9J8_9PEZI|nr:uncharacterized protein P152DRAFT_498345 [Eremomyces bilateralis CBS 781.70]KAF1814757.1 hypothetical protein P152DRAFT_498345 [Eremomyces bilateralis CBS 781.70]
MDSGSSVLLFHHRQILTEAEACEIWRKHRHPNIAQYLVSVVRDGRIIRLGSVKDPTTLSQMLNDGMSFNRSACLQGIQAGTSHMHNLGLGHNDFRPIKHRDRWRYSGNY